MICVNARFLTQELTGVQRFAFELSKQLAQKKELDLVFVAPRNILHAELADELNVQIIGKASGHIWEQLELPRFLSKCNNPLLLCLANTAPLHYKNKVVTVHDLAFLHNPLWFSYKFRLFYNWLIPRIVHNAKHVITVSEFSKSEISQRLTVPPDKISVIYNAADSRFAILNKQPEQTEKQYILSVGSIDPRKNLKIVFEAHHHLHDLSIPLKVAGGSSKIFNDLDITENLQNVQFLGRVSDDELIQLYKEATVFVYPSLYEGFGLPPVEAMKSGVPVVTSDIPVLREVCQDAALYVDPMDSVAVSQAVRSLLTDEHLYNKMIVAGHKVSATYKWETSAKKLISVLKQC